MDPQSPRKRPVVFVNRFFHPDESATSQILSDVAFHISQTGRAVSVVCGRLTYDAADRLPQSEILRGLGVFRVATTRFGRAGMLARSVDYLSFYISASWRIARTLRKGDILVVKTDPPLLSVPLGLIARFKGARLVNWLQDLYPEVASELGVSLAKGPIGKFLKRLRNRSLRRAHMNVAIGETMKQRLIQEGVEVGSIATLPNFVDDGVIQPLGDHSAELRAEWGFAEDDFIVGYSGNLGRAHDLETVLNACAQLSQHPRIRFLFIGGGHLHQQLRAEMQARKLTNIVLKPYQPRNRLAHSLGLPDVHWVSLKPALEGLIVPSKIYGIAAAGRPVIMIGSPDGEIGQLLRRHGFGAAIAPGDGAALARHLIELSENRDQVAKQGRAARSFIDHHAERAKTLQAWSELLGRLDGA